MPMDDIFQTNIDTAKKYLYQYIQTSLTNKGKEWLDMQLSKLENDPKVRDFYLAFSAASRFLDNTALPEAEWKETESLRAGFRPENWTLLQAGRVLILLFLPAKEKTVYQQVLHQLFDTADMNEQVALYSALPLLAYPSLHVKRAAEGVRTNMTVVFDAIALGNPYPADFMEENAWNQLYLKAAFMDRPIHKIYGIEKRANERLARIISDYAHERWAAGRLVSPELWRPVGRFVDETIAEDLKKVFAGTNPLQQQAVALICHESTNPEAKKMLELMPEWTTLLVNKGLSWQSIGEQWYKEQF